jgi:hypothetical protein
MPDIEINGTKLCVSLETIINGMSMEQKKEVLSWLATDWEVMESVVDHILGRDEQGWSTGDSNRCQKILGEVEDFHLANVRYDWKPWDEIKQKLRNIRADERLYWVLYHQIDSQTSKMVFDELRRLGVESNYTTKEADEDIATIHEVIKDTFKQMAKDKGEN